MIKLSELSMFYKRCEEYNKNKQGVGLDPVFSLYKQGDSELLSYLRQDCDKDELFEMIKIVVDDLNNNRMTRMGIAKGYITPVEYPSRNEDLANWLKKWNNLYFEFLAEPDKEYVLSFFFLDEGYAKYKADTCEREFLEDKTIISLYGETVTSNYNLIPLDDTVELLNLNPARIYDKVRNKTIYVEIGERFASILSELMQEGAAKKVAVKGKGKQIYDGKYTKEYLVEALEMGNVFSFSKLLLLPDITKMYSAEYDNQLWISKNNNELTFEELCQDITVQAEGIRTQMIHLMFVNRNNQFFINHIDHEFIYYTLEEYEKRQHDSKMKTKGSARKRIKTFKIDEASIPMDYPCIMYQLSEKENEYKEVSVPFLYFVINTYFCHKDLIEEYFSKII